MDIRITGKDCMEEMLRLQSRVKELEGACNNAIRALSEVELLYTRNPVIREALGKIYAVLAKPLTDKDK